MVYVRPELDLIELWLVGFTDHPYAYVAKMNFLTQCLRVLKGFIYIINFIFVFATNLLNRNLVVIRLKRFKLLDLRDPFE